MRAPRFAPVLVTALLLAPPDARAESPEPLLGARAEGAERLGALVATPSASLVVTGLATTRVERVTGFHVDSAQTTLPEETAVNPALRLGLRAEKRWRRLRLSSEVEHDVTTGTLLGAPSIEGVGLPNGEGRSSELRKLWGRVSFGDAVHLGGGMTTSHFGLGLVANDGVHGGERFGDPRGGDRVLRGLVALGLHRDAGLVATATIDSVVDDDVLLENDTAWQVAAALVAGYGRATTAGIYAVRRDQEMIDPETGEVRGFESYVVDVTAQTRRALGGGSLRIGAEAAYVFGQTTLAPTVEHPTHRMNQLGIAGQVGWEKPRYGGALDFLFASGDAQLEDGRLTAFRADPNYEMGLLLFRHVLAGQTGRAPVTASDPELVGVPAEDLDRFPTRGGVSNAVLFFPRAFVRPLPNLEVYAGPLLAFSAAKLADPYHTQMAGGVPTNALGGSPGHYMGTEIDVGARYRYRIAGAELSLCVEAALFQPAAAFVNETGQPMEPVYGGRTLIGISL